MSGTIRAALKRWRENYVLSSLLAATAKPLWRISRGLAAQLQSKVVKNGVTIRLANGKEMVIGRDAGIGLASLLFWQGLDGYEPETSRTLRFFFAHCSTFVDVGANCGLYSIVAALSNPEIKVVAFEPFPPIFQCLQKNVSLNQLGGGGILHAKTSLCRATRGRRSSTSHVPKERTSPRRARWPKTVGRSGKVPMKPKSIQ